MRRIDSRDILILAAAYWLFVGVPQTLGRPLPHFEGVSSAMSFAAPWEAPRTRPPDANIDPYLLAVMP